MENKSNQTTLVEALIYVSLLTAPFLSIGIILSQFTHWIIGGFVSLFVGLNLMTYIDGRKINKANKTTKFILSLVIITIFVLTFLIMYIIS